MVMEYENGIWKCKMEMGTYVRSQKAINVPEKKTPHPCEPRVREQQFTFSVNSSHIWNFHAFTKKAVAK